MPEKPIAGWESKIIGYGDVSPTELAAHPKNWRVHPEHQTDAMEGILSEVGWIDPVKVNKRTGVIIDGHMRVALALKNKQPTVPVAWLNLTDEEEDKALATFNTVAQLAYADRDNLSDLLSSVEFEDRAVRDLLSGMRERFLDGVAPAGDDGGGGPGGDDAKAEYPITPVFSEKYDYVVIFCTNEIDFNWLREVLKLRTEASYKSSLVGTGHVIHVDRFREVFEVSHGK